MQRMKDDLRSGRRVLVYEDTGETYEERIKRLLQEYEWNIHERLL